MPGRGHLNFALTAHADMVAGVTYISTSKSLVDDTAIAIVVYISLDQRRVLVAAVAVVESGAGVFR